MDQAGRRLRPLQVATGARARRPVARGQTVQSPRVEPLCSFQSIAAGAALQPAGVDPGHGLAAEMQPAPDFEQPGRSPGPATNTHSNRRAAHENKFRRESPLMAALTPDTSNRIFSRRFDSLI